MDHLDAAFGQSHDGYNGATWAAGARAIREDGLVESRLGSVRQLRGDEQIYANHPPGTPLAIAATESVLGERELATRLPAGIASLVALAGSFRLLLQMGVTPPAAAAGVALGLGCPMFFVFGTMADTPILGFAFAPFLASAWVGATESTPRLPLLAALGLASGLFAWQGVVLGAAVGFALIARRGAKRAGTALVVGSFAAVAASALVALAAYGSFEPAVEAFTRRAGGLTHQFTVAEFLGRQLNMGRDLFGIWYFIAPLLLVAGLVVEKTRSTMLLATATSIAYTLAFSEGAWVHNYWNYWLLLPAVIGAAAAAHVVITAPDVAWLKRSGRIAVVGFTSSACAVVPVVFPSLTEAARDGGVAIGRDASRLKVPSSQGHIYVAGLSLDQAFVRYYTRRELEALGSPGELARESPDFIVLRNDPWRRPAIAFVTAAELEKERAERPPAAEDFDRFKSGPDTE